MGCSFPFCRSILDIHIYNNSLFNFSNTATRRTIGPNTDEKFNWDGIPFELNLDAPVNIRAERVFRKFTFQLMPDRYHPHWVKINSLEIPLDRPSFEENLIIKGSYYNFVLRINKIADCLRIRLESEKKERRFHSVQHRSNSSKKSIVILPINHPNSAEQILKRFLRYHEFRERNIRDVIRDYHQIRIQNIQLRFIEIEIDTKYKIIKDILATN